MEILVAIQKSYDILFLITILIVRNSVFNEKTYDILYNNSPLKLVKCITKQLLS